jgi:Trk-type K+ transport system membrane component
MAVICHTNCDNVSNDLRPLRFKVLMFFSRVSLIDWVCFLVFNIGNPTVESVPTGTRVIIGLLQAVSVRNAGFQVVPLAAVAPALKSVV